MTSVIARFLRLLGVLAVLYLLAALVLAITGLQESLPPAGPPIADAAVVFGNKVEPGGQPSLSLASRLDKVVEVYRCGLVRRVIVSGGVGKEGWDEAEVMAAYLADHGIPPGAILVNSQGDNTYLTARNTRALAVEHDLRSFILVSHFYHLPRARLIFRRLGLETVAIAHSERFVPRDFYYGLLREVIAYPVYFISYRSPGQR